LPSGATKGIGFAVDAGVALLHAAVMPAAQQFTGPREKRSSDRDSAFGPAVSGLFERYGEHLIVQI
jgi:hypothetical protein